MSNKGKKRLVKRLTKLIDLIEKVDAPMKKIHAAATVERDKLQQTDARDRT